MSTSTITESSEDSTSHNNVSNDFQCTEFQELLEDGSFRTTVEIRRGDKSPVVKKTFPGRVLMDLNCLIGGDEDFRYVVTRRQNDRFVVFTLNCRTGYSSLEEYVDYNSMRANYGLDWDLPNEVLAVAAADDGIVYPKALAV